MNYVYLFFIFLISVASNVEARRHHRSQNQQRRQEGSCSWIKAMLDGHNARRLLVAQGALPGQQPARKMAYMIWDDELAEKATKWAEKRIFNHNPDVNYVSNTGKIVKTGENLWWQKSKNVKELPSVDEILDSWFSEHSRYNYGPVFSEEGGPDTGHYTQMVWSTSTRLGCGSSLKIENGRRLYYVVCNYAPAGNIEKEVPYPLGKTGKFVNDKVSGPVYGSNCD